MSVYLVQLIDSAGKFHRYTQAAASHADIQQSAFARYGELRLCSVRRAAA